MVNKRSSNPFNSQRPAASRQLSLFGLVTGIGKFLSGLGTPRPTSPRRHLDEIPSIRPVAKPPAAYAEGLKTAQPQEVPELDKIWTELRSKYFPEHAELSFYKVEWSKRRQKRTLASCHIKKRIVHVASELKHASYKEWLEPLLYHEMCHARLGMLEKVNGKTPWHGGVFRELERQHPGTKALQNWIKSGGWSKAVRSARARKAFQKANRYL